MALTSITKFFASFKQLWLSMAEHHSTWTWRLAFLCLKVKILYQRFDVTFPEFMSLCWGWFICLWCYCIVLMCLNVHCRVHLFAQTSGSRESAKGHFFALALTLIKYNAYHIIFARYTKINISNDNVWVIWCVSRLRRIN